MNGSFSSRDSAASATGRSTASKALRGSLEIVATIGRLVPAREGVAITVLHDLIKFRQPG